MAVCTGFERTAAQDVGYGLRQLTEVAVRALSPGINDPTTAVHALSHSSALLCELASRDLAPRLLRDEEGAVRVVLRGPDRVDLLELAVTPPRRYGAAAPFVLARLSSLLGELAWCVQLSDQRREIADQLAPAARHHRGAGLRCQGAHPPGGAGRPGPARAGRALGPRREDLVPGRYGGRMVNRASVYAARAVTSAPSP